MDEQRLQLSLRKVYHAHEERELLKLSRRGIGAIDDRASEVHEGVDEKGSEVLHEEDGLPGNLRTCDMSVILLPCKGKVGRLTQVLHVYSTLVTDTGIVHSDVLNISDCRAIASLGDSQTVNRESGGFGNLLKYLCRGSLTADDDAFREVLDRTAYKICQPSQLSTTQLYTHTAWAHNERNLRRRHVVV